MNNFEKQLSASSKRLAAKQISDIAPVVKPSIQRHISAAWYTTPAAAAAGLLVGLFLQFGSPQQGESAPNVAVVHDTIVEHVYDNIRVETVPQVLLAKSDTKAEKVYKKTANNTSANTNRRTTGNIGRTITEDGINYSMLISCAY